MLVWQDSLAARREGVGGGGDGAAGRVLAQLLAEMDGVASRGQRSAATDVWGFRGWLGFQGERHAAWLQRSLVPAHCEGVGARTRACRSDCNQQRDCGLPFC